MRVVRVRTSVSVMRTNSDFQSQIAFWRFEQMQEIRVIPKLQLDIISGSLGEHTAYGHWRWSCLLFIVPVVFRPGLADFCFRQVFGSGPIGFGPGPVHVSPWHKHNSHDDDV